MKKPKASKGAKATAHHAAAHHAAAAAKHPAHPQAKAAKSAKHTAAAKKATAKRAHRPRKWSPDEDVALCSARAVAESLRLATGVRVADADVLALHVAAGGHLDDGASILDVLRAAADCGLAGHKPVRFECIAGALSETSERLILGLDLPQGTHTVLRDRGRRWWSWGRRYSAADFPGAVIEEAWKVTWR